uniref:NADH-ubiquinone oxidoreductase chain 3 n=1 Tax=Mahasena oolona TaxID=2024751 RepID=A0A343QZ67_9NEOP|nr:NADH dehydrogenase subunit 3 [Mahasena oolona]ATV96138.1 NADH dehydrogenase subunit 3 [Mahasena oolona]
MSNLITLCIIITILSNLMMMISTLISKKSHLDREKSSPFECGFNPQFSTRMPFSLHFFLITLIFLIFDVEIALILPMIETFKLTNLLMWFLLSMFFFLILLMGIYHEWNQNMLKWLN